MNIKGFELVNEEKVGRAISGTQRADGSNNGGVSKADGSYEDADLLAEYDRLGGLITRNGDKVKTGSFYDFKGKKPLKEPNVIFLYNVNGETVEVEDGQELPGAVKATKVLGEKKAAKAEGKVSRRSKKN